MKRMFVGALFTMAIGGLQPTFCAAADRAVDIPTRPEVVQRFLFISPEKPKASLILFAGGDGGLDISRDGDIRFLTSNFLVRSRQLFADKGFAVAVVDAPSDRQSKGLAGFRQKPEHVADIKAVIAWLRQQNNVPVWLVGTSRGTQSAAFIATQLTVGQGGPDGLVLTSTILSDDKGRPVPEMPLETIAIPVLVVHHEQDGCRHCSYSLIPSLMKKLTGTKRKDLATFTGGKDQGDSCQAFAHHGFNGLEIHVLGRIADWIALN